MNSSFKIALDFIKENGLAEHLPITRVGEGKEDVLFEQVMEYNRNEGEQIKKEIKELLDHMVANDADISEYQEMLKSEKGVAKEVIAEYIKELKN